MISKVVFERIVGIAADEQDIRVGIDRVRAAVMRAETDGRRQVTHGDGEAAVRAAIAPVLQARASGLPEGERTILYRIAEQSLAGDTMMAGAVFEEMQDYIGVRKTAYHAWLRKLAAIGIIDLLHTQNGHEVFLRYPPGEIFSACAGDLASSGKDKQTGALNIPSDP